MEKRCSFCGGSGWETSEDPKTGYPVPSVCETCNGTGYEETKEEEDGKAQQRGLRPSL